MKKTNILFFVLISFAFALPAFSQNKVDVFGYYTIVSATDDFIDISEIHLAGKYGEQQTPKVYGLIRMRERGASDFDLMRPTLIGKKLSFMTKTVGGVHYAFTGTFTKLGDFPVSRPEGQTILRGTLTKYSGKKKLAAGTFNFIYSAGD
jgi:hypothetical protein